MPHHKKNPEQGKKPRTAVIFAGGKSSRMGEDKALLPFGGCASLAEYQYRRMKQLFPHVYISTKKRKTDFAAPLILDIYPESSPLIGLLSVFASIEDHECFILSVDAPFVGEEIIEALYGLSGDPSLDAIIARSPGGIQPLCGIYRRSIIPHAERFVREGEHRLHTLLQTANSRFVNFEKETDFLNLNRPHDYRKALLRLRKGEQYL